MVGSCQRAHIIFFDSECVKWFGNLDDVKGPLGFHRLIETLKHMFAISTNLSNLDFVNINDNVANMLSLSFAKSVRDKPMVTVVEATAKIDAYDLSIIMLSVSVKKTCNS
ncbi:hypothetical protein CASFOL_022963 [Castilleja foliolosa]|uniref:Uncharacterized protein n=1 Tax=Castilleja foliolosa TaxID=1961234 RepID=A0ABD3CT78_9LAMI